MSNVFLKQSSPSIKEGEDCLLFEKFKDSSNSCKVLIWSIDPFTNEKVFLIQRSGSGEWGLPGGHIHTNEPFEEGLAREVYEEISLKINPQRCKLIFSFLRTTKKDKRGYVYFYEYEHIDFRQIPRPNQIKPDKGFDRPEVMEIRWIKSLKDLNCLDWIDAKPISLIVQRLIKARLQGKESLDEREYKKLIQKGEA